MTAAGGKLGTPHECFVHTWEEVAEMVAVRCWGQGTCCRPGNSIRRAADLASVVTPATPAISVTQEALGAPHPGGPETQSWAFLQGVVAEGFCQNVKDPDQRGSREGSCCRQAGVRVSFQRGPPAGVGRKGKGRSWESQLRRAQTGQGHVQPGP